MLRFYYALRHDVVAAIACRYVAAADMRQQRFANKNGMFSLTL